MEGKKGAHKKHLKQGNKICVRIMLKKAKKKWSESKNSYDDSEKKPTQKEKRASPKVMETCPRLEIQHFINEAKVS